MVVASEHQLARLEIKERLVCIYLDNCIWIVQGMGMDMNTQMAYARQQQLMQQRAAQQQQQQQQQQGYGQMMYPQGPSTMMYPQGQHSNMALRRSADQMSGGAPVHYEQPAAKRYKRVISDVGPHNLPACGLLVSILWRLEKLFSGSMLSFYCHAL